MVKVVDVDVDVDDDDDAADGDMMIGAAYW